ncbi:hypothetical protein Micbo1qcDRAFT_164728, partial [Microdochium bolleyi]
MKSSLRSSSKVSQYRLSRRRARRSREGLVGGLPSSLLLRMAKTMERATSFSRRPMVGDLVESVTGVYSVVNGWLDVSPLLWFVWG